MKKQFFAAVIGAAMVLPMVAQAQAQAQGQSAYVGVSAGRAEGKLSADDFSFKDNDTGYKVFGGYDFDNIFGVQAGYVDFGSGEGTFAGDTLSVKPKAFYVAGTATYNIDPQFSLSAKVGASANRTKFNGTVDGASGERTINKTTAMFGVGAAYNFDKNFSVLVEYENFGKAVDENGTSLKTSLISAGVRYKF